MAAQHCTRTNQFSRDTELRFTTRAGWGVSREHLVDGRDLKLRAAHGLGLFGREALQLSWASERVCGRGFP